MVADFLYPKSEEPETSCDSVLINDEALTKHLGK